MSSEFNRELMRHRMELFDDPIVVNIKAKKNVMVCVTEILPIWQSYLIESIEIKGMTRKNTLFNSKECILTVDVGQKRMCNFTLQLFYHRRKTESYIYELGIPVYISPQQQYRIWTSGIDGNLIIILHGKRARQLQ